MSNSKKINTEIILEGSYQDFDKIYTLFQSGELEELLGISISDVDASAKKVPSPPSLVSNLSSWFKHHIIDDWEYETTLLGTFFAQQNNPKLAFEATRSVDNTTLDAEVNNSFETALELGENSNNSPEIITELVTSLQTCENDEIAWQLALSLGKLEPKHSQAAIAQRKEFNLGNVMLELLVAIKQGQDEKLDILLQLYSTEEDYLPLGLEIDILDGSGDTSAQVKTKKENSDSYINLSLECSPTEQFSVIFSLDNDRVEEYFQV